MAIHDIVDHFEADDIRGYGEMAQKVIEGRQWHMTAFAFEIEMAQNSNYSFSLIFSSKYRSHVFMLEKTNDFCDYQNSLRGNQSYYRLYLWYHDLNSA